jgi:transcriptional regulator with XRE-family HTH domain
MTSPSQPGSGDDAERLAMAEKLRRCREYLGLNQDEVSNHLGIPRTALSNIETGQRKVDAIELRKLAHLYRRPVSYFTGEAEQESVPTEVQHLARTASELSKNDLQELSRFADFLKSRSSLKEE